MLRVMNQAAQNPAQPDSASFAGILAALAGPAKKSASAWIDDGLEEDVATFSYEHALRTHARHRRPEPDEQMLKRAVDPGSIRIQEAFPAKVDSAGQTEKSKAAFGSGTGAEVVSKHVAHQTLELNLKRASITVRLSDAECAQLRMRASDAGLTISGYLRSCTFEAEALRAEVKQALAELRNGGGKAGTAKSSGAGRIWPAWLRRLLHRGQMGEQVAQA